MKSSDLRTVIELKILEEHILGLHNWPAKPPQKRLRNSEEQSDYYRSNHIKLNDSKEIMNITINYKL